MARVAGERERARLVRRPFVVRTDTGDTISCEVDAIEEKSAAASTAADLAPRSASAEGGGGLMGLEDDSRADCVVLCHGQWSSMYDPLMLAISEGILRFHGDGAAGAPADASGRRGRKTEVIRMSFTTSKTEPFSGYFKEREELRCVVQHLQDTKRRVRCVVGHSKGATVVSLFASKYEKNEGKSLGNEACLICISGRFDMRKGVARSIGEDIVDYIESTGKPQLVVISKPRPRDPFWLTKERLEERASINMEQVMMGINNDEADNNWRLCVIHGERDERIPVDDSKGYVRAFDAGNASQSVASELHIIEEANHCFTNPVHRKQLVTFVSEFFHKHMSRFSLST